MNVRLSSQLKFPILQINRKTDFTHANKRCFVTQENGKTDFTHANKRRFVTHENRKKMTLHMQIKVVL